MLENNKVSEFKLIAKYFRIKGSYRLRKNEIISRIRQGTKLKDLLSIIEYKQLTKERKIKKY